MTSSNQKPKSNLFIAVAKFLLIVLVAIYLIIWIFSPIVVRHFAQDPLRDLGVLLSEDSSIRYNPFTSTLTVSELQLLDKKQNQVMSVEYAEISIHLHRLLFKQLYVSEFLLEGTKIKIVKDQQSIMVAGVDISASPESAPKEPAAEDQSDGSSLDFTVVIPELKLKRILFDAQVDGAPQTLLLNELLITNTSLSPLEQQVSLSINAQVNDAPLMLNADVFMQAGSGTIDSSFSYSN